MKQTFKEHELYRQLHGLALDYEELLASHERLRAALISACHAAGIRGQAIPDPVHNVGELQWAPEAREALKQIPKGE